MSSDSELETSESEEDQNSDHDCDWAKSKPRNQPSTSRTVVQPKKKRRVESPTLKSEDLKKWTKPKLTNSGLGALTLLNFEDETASTKEIREFISKEFPFFKTFNSSRKWINFMTSLKRTPGIVTCDKKDGQHSILELDASEFGPLKKKLQNTMTKGAEALKLTMANSEKFDFFLENVTNYECDDSDGSDPKPTLTILQLLQGVFGGDVDRQMTVEEICTKIIEKEPYFVTRMTKLERNVVLNVKHLTHYGVFLKFKISNQIAAWKLNPQATGLPLPSRIPNVSSPIKTLIETAIELSLVGNASKNVANFYYKGDDPTILKNEKSLQPIDVDTEGQPGRYMCYIAWMSCLDPTNCKFGKDCFNFIFGNSDHDFCGITQSKISMAVNLALKKRKAKSPTDISDEEESGCFDNSFGQDDSDISDDNEDDKKKKNDPGQSCKGPLDFLMQYPNHEFRKENCLALWTTNNRKLKRPMKNFLRGAYKDMSKARGMYHLMTYDAYTMFDSLGGVLPFRKKYVARAQSEGRLPYLMSQSFLPKNINISIRPEELDKLVRENQLTTTSADGETVTITVD